MSMQTMATLVLTLSVIGCGIDTSKLNNDSTLKDQTAGAPTESVKPSTSATTADPRQTQTTVKVHTETDVTVTTGAADEADPGSTDAPKADGRGSANGTLLHFADGAYGWFFADGSFDRGAVYMHGQQAPGYCHFEAPDCEGRCVLESLPAKDSLFTNGSAYFRAWETETDMGRTVVASLWQGGHCQAQVKTLQHAYSPNHSWVLDAGDSTVPSEHSL